MNRVFVSCFHSRMNRFNLVIFAGVIIFLSLTGLNDVCGAAQVSKSSSSKSNGDLITTAGSSANKTTAAVPKTKYPQPNEMLQGGGV